MDFEKMGIDPKLVEGLKLMGIKVPTPIQASCIPELKKGKDLIGLSLTGSGKTAAFGLPILEKIIPGDGLQALIITPTRELCGQVREEMEKMGKYLPINIKSVYGGVGFYQQIEDLKIAEIIVATPGRLLDHMGRRNVDLRGIKFVVLDEADRMFDMGFEEDIDKILRATPHTRQTIMFSATMQSAAKNIAKKYLKSPVMIQEQMNVDKSLLKQVFYSVRREDKFSLLVHLLKNKTSGPAIVFCGTKREVDKVARNLKKERLDVLPVHGDLHQGRRQLAVNSFKQGKIDVLVATDVAARGLDIKDVSHVYNYDVPRTPDEYTHRIGRTARAGKKGDAVTLLSERDYENFSKIVRYGRLDIKQEQTPEYARVNLKAEGPSFGNDRSEGRGDRRDRPDRGNFRERREYPQRREWSNGPRERPRGNYNSQPRDYNSPQQGSSRNFSSQSRPRDYPSRGHSQSRPSYSRDYSSPQRQSMQSQHGKAPHHTQQYQNEHREQAPSRSNDYGENVNFKSHTETAVKGGMERTPRTHAPLFPESHYNPEYQKFKKERPSTQENSEGTSFRPARIHKPSYPTDKNKSFHNTDSDSRRPAHSEDRKKHFESKGDKVPFYKQGKGKFRGKKRF